jgi:hypothetical protein
MAAAATAFTATGTLGCQESPMSLQATSAPPSVERHKETFGPRTGDGGVNLWIPVEGLRGSSGSVRFRRQLRGDAPLAMTGAPRSAVLPPRRGVLLN